jgi:hypothetical protein
MVSVGFGAKADVVEILWRLSLSISVRQVILLLVQKQGVTDVLAAL